MNTDSVLHAIQEDTHYSGAEPILTEQDIVRRQCEVSEEEAVEMLRRANGDVAEAIAQHLQTHHRVAMDPGTTPHEETAAQAAIRELRAIVDTKNDVYSARMIEKTGEGDGEPGECQSERGGDNQKIIIDDEPSQGQGDNQKIIVDDDDELTGTTRLAADFDAFCRHSG